MIIDSHQHFWRIGANGCVWPTPDLSAIYRNFMPMDLEAESASVGLSGSVLVQSQESGEDTDWLISLAEATPFVKAVVGWADLKTPEAPARIAALAVRPKLRGLRPMLQSLPEDWILDPTIAPAIEAMQAHSLTFDALIYTRHLPSLRLLASRYPALPIVIDHGAKPPIAGGKIEVWREEIAETARSPNIFCKLSGLLTEAAPNQPKDALAPYIAHLVSVFGAERLMWGSDWPVLNLAGGYQEWFDLACALSGFRARALDQVLGGVASAFYKLERAQ
jgi:L-fuconolactonase